MSIFQNYLFAFALILTPLCLPACSSGACPEGSYNYQGACVEDDFEPPDGDWYKPEPDIVVPDITPSPVNPRDYNTPPELTEDDVGDLPSDLVETVEFDSDWDSMVVWFRGDQDNYIFPNYIITPEGSTIYDLSKDLGNDFINDTFDFHYYPDFGLSLFLPNSPRLSAASGTWTIELISAFPGNTIHVMTTSGTSLPKRISESHLGLNIWFVGIDGYESDTSASPEFGDAFKVTRKLYKDFDIVLDPVIYHQASEQQAQEFGIIDNFTEYHEMMKMSASVSNSYPNIFLIKGFGSADLEGVLGMAAQIPGPPELQGSPFAGVAVAMEYFDYFPRTMGLVMAHELGHWLGLFHTTEFTGEGFDALDDTPECHVSKDADANGYVDNNECNPYGTGNMMFWLVPDNDNFITGEGGVSLTPDQQWVLRRYPVLQHTK